jgi:LCP family protein required for cell wall assembly
MNNSLSLPHPFQKILRRTFLTWFSALSLLIAACGSVTSPTPTVPAPTLTSIPSPIPTTSATLSPIPPTATVPPTATPTAQDKGQPTLGYYYRTPGPNETLTTAIPTPLNQIKLDKNLINILLIGTDYRANARGFRTDTLIIVSINTATGLATMLSIPRDLYVYVPGMNSPMQRINVAYDAGGPALLEQTILYNLGIPIHYYALVNFDGFRKIVDTVGGIDVPVNCQLTEYKIKDPTLDESDPNNYELYTQPIGLIHMDGALALWYARARPTGDFARSYRQRQVMRAIYHAALNAQIIPQIPGLYDSFKDVVETDMGIGDVLQFIPLTAKLNDTQIRSLSIGPNQTYGWRTPDGQAVLLPRAGALLALVKEVLTAPSDNQLQRAATLVEVWNVSQNAVLTTLAQETLVNEGFAPVVGQPDGSVYTTTTIIDFTTTPKGSPIKKLQSVLHVEAKNVIAQPDANSPVSFRVILADDYNPCPRLDWMDHSGDPTATPGAPTAPPPTEAPTEMPTETAGP